MTFYVVYSDQKVVEASPGDAIPTRKVQVIVQPHPDVGWHTQSGYDYYVWKEGQDRWVGVDIFGLFDFLLDTGMVMFGETLTTKDFNEAMSVALDIRRVKLEKTGWLSQERRPDG